MSANSWKKQFGEILQKVVIKAIHDDGITDPEEIKRRMGRAWPKELAFNRSAQMNRDWYAVTDEFSTKLPNLIQAYRKDP